MNDDGWQKLYDHIVQFNTDPKSVKNYTSWEWMTPMDLAPADSDHWSHRMHRGNLSAVEKGDILREMREEGIRGM